MKKTKILNQNEVSSFLVQAWNKIFVFSPKVYPKTLNEYINMFSALSQKFRIIINNDFLKIKNYTFDVGRSLVDMEAELSFLLEITNNIFEECQLRYFLTRKQRRLLSRTQIKNEEIWAKIDSVLIFIQSSNSALFTGVLDDFLAEEIPYKKDFSIILKDFERFSFQKN